LSEKFALLFRREGGDNFFEARIAPEREKGRRAIALMPLEKDVINGTRVR